MFERLIKFNAIEKVKKNKQNDREYNSTIESGVIAESEDKLPVAFWQRYYRNS